MLHKDMFENFNNNSRHQERKTVKLKSKFS